MTAPVRLRLSRTKGFKLQEHSRTVNGLEAVKVTRPGLFGNPFTLMDGHAIGYNRDMSRIWAVEEFRRYIALPVGHKLFGPCYEFEFLAKDHARLIEQLPSLRGRNLACFCDKMDPCHADVLLEIANRPVCEALT